ncbi:MAG: isochorismate synthase [Chloroflexi bacterium]|nr:MAG: isochorismate synthase [Chloroflexota bacterium]
MLNKSIVEQYGRLVSYSLPCEGVSLGNFLRAMRGNPRFYWESSHDDVAFAGTGIAVELVAYSDRFTSIERQVRELFDGAVILNDKEPLAAPRLFGGFSFRDDFIPDETWADFPPAHFVLPHYQLLQFHGQTWLTINAHTDDDPESLRDDLHAALTAKIEQIKNATLPFSKPQHTYEINYPLSFEAWKAGIHAAIQRMAAGELQKVVLARVAEIRFPYHVDVDSALDYLAKVYPQTYRFLFEPRPYHAFYGATPELLAGVYGNQVKTMGLAGSIRRGKTPVEDGALTAELLNSPKDRYEHQLVVDRIRERLTHLTHNLQIAPTGIMTLSNIHHLHTAIEGTLREGVGVLQVAETLHPTPALGGEPRDVAMQIIRESEPVPRGWYAAPVGWIDRNLNGQFSVAIRSAVAQGKRVWAYAGAGIVPASDPQKEWDETALKFQPMLNALRIG